MRTLLAFPNFRLLSQLGAGVAGVSYRAIDERDAKEVVIHHLVHAAQDSNWQQQKLSLAHLERLDGSALCEVRAVDLDSAASPWIAVYQRGDCLADLIDGKRRGAKILDAKNLVSKLQDHKESAVKIDRDDALNWMSQVATALGAIHRLTVAHGSVTAGSIYIDADGRAFLDPVVVDTGSVGLLSPRHIACLADEAATAPADLSSLANILELLLLGETSTNHDVDSSAASTLLEIDKTPGGEVSRLLGEMRDEEPAWRPEAEEVAFRLAALVDAGGVKTGSKVSPPPSEVGAGVFEIGGAGVQQPSAATNGETSSVEATSSVNEAGSVEDKPRLPTLGRYIDLVEVGEGAMGRVFRAIDPTTNTAVALKVLTGDWRSKPKVLRRFQKEARLLSEVDNPYVAKFLELAHHDGMWFMAVEFVDGEPLGAYLDTHQRMPAIEALKIMIDVARGLVDAHARGIVHRDIKPDNILLTKEGNDAGTPKTKLVDFGIARHIDESESLAMTRQGGVLGTPLYMAPEQCAGSPVDERADIYALGSTLFHMIAGRPPFSGGGPQAIMASKMRDRAPNLRTLIPDVAEPIVYLVSKALETDRDARIPTAAAFIEEAEDALGMRATKFGQHPPRLEANGVKRYEFTWELKASAAALWPYVSNTERVNRALGLVPLDARFEVRNPGGPDEEVVQIAHIKHLGLSVTWREHPYEWIEGRRMGSVREFIEGPFNWFISTVDLEPLDDGRTKLTHIIEVEPRGILGAAAALVEINVKARRNLDRVYRRIERLVGGGSGTESSDRAFFVDAFEPVPVLDPEVEHRVERIEGRMVDEGAPALSVERLGAFVRSASAAEIARIRPFPFARRFGLEPDDVVDACLVGAKEGLLEIKWDLLCPKCRIPAALEATLKNLKDHAHCEACNLDFDLDLASGVEMVFASHPQVRSPDNGLYCAASPAHSPHVVAQIRMAPQERFELALDLSEGAFRVASRQLPWAAVFNVHARASTSRWDVKLSEGVASDLPRSLKPGRQVLVFDNDTDREVVLRVERTAASHEAFSAARAAAHPLFRKYFPGEVLSSGRLVSVANVILVVVTAPNVEKLYLEMSESDVYAELHRLFFALDEHVGKEGGAVVKLVGNGVFATFADPAAAVRAALEVRTSVHGHILSEDLRIAAHQGPALAVTVNGRLDYFGRTVHDIDCLLEKAKANSIVLSATLSADPVVASLLRKRGAEADLIEVERGGTAQMIALTAPTVAI